MSATTEHPRGLAGIVLLWFPQVAPIAAWAVHIVSIASLARLSCSRGSAETSRHLITVGTLAVVAVSMLLSWRLVRIGGDPPDADDTASRHVFLGRLGLLIGAFNFAVIVLEELYVLGFHPVRCGG